MTWIWATLLLILSAPFVLWPLLRFVPSGTDEGVVDGERTPPDPDD